MDGIQILINKFFLDGTVVALNEGIDLGTPRIDKEVGNLVSLQLLIKGTLVFSTIIRLPDSYGTGINFSETIIKVFHVGSG